MGKGCLWEQRLRVGGKGQWVRLVGMRQWAEGNGQRGDGGRVRATALLIAPDLCVLHLPVLAPASGSGRARKQLADPAAQGFRGRASGGGEAAARSLALLTSQP